MRFDVYRDRNNDYRVRLVDDDGHIIGVSPGYRAKSSALVATEMMKKHMPAALIETSVPG